MRLILFSMIAVIVMLVFAASIAVVIAQQEYSYYALFKIKGSNFNVTVVYEFDDPLWVNLTQMFVSISSNEINFTRIICTANTCVAQSSIAQYVIGGYLELWYDNLTYIPAEAFWQTLDENGSFVNGGSSDAYALSYAYIMYSGNVNPIEMRGYGVKSVNNSDSSNSDNNSVVLGGYAERLFNSKLLMFAAVLFAVLPLTYKIFAVPPEPQHNTIGKPCKTGDVAVPPPTAKRNR